MRRQVRFDDSSDNNFVGNVENLDPTFSSNRDENSLKQMIEEGNWYSAYKRFTTHPWEIAERDCHDTGHNSLHSIVLRCTNDMKAQKLIHQILSSDSHYIPVAASAPCHEGWTVLHICCRNVEVPDDILLKVARINPSVMSVQDEEGDTPLHSALRYGASDETLRNLIEIGYRNYNTSFSTSIFTEADYDGDLPLHSAISHNASPEIISLLLDAYPPSIFAINSSNFFSPLHIAVECCRFDIVEVITRSHAAMGCVSQLLSMSSRQGQNVLNLLWEKYHEDEDDVDSDEIWECIIKLLLNSQEDLQTTVSPSTLTTDQVLSCAIRLGPIICPVEFVAKFISKHPQLPRQQDSQGRLPLHQAILHYPRLNQTITSSFRLDQSIKSLSFDEQQKRKDPTSSSSGSIGTDHLPKPNIGQREKDTVNQRTQDKKEAICHTQDSKLYDSHEDDVFIISPSCDASPIFTNASPDSFINLFIDCFSEGAKLRDNYGNYPLHLAIEANIPWEKGLKKVFRAHPEIIHVANQNQLLPFMMTKSLDCTYHLLRQSPSLFANSFQVNTKKTQQKVTSIQTNSLSITQHNFSSSSSFCLSRSLKRNRMDINKSSSPNKKGRFDRFSAVEHPV